MEKFPIFLCNGDNIEEVTFAEAKKYEYGEEVFSIPISHSFVLTKMILETPEGCYEIIYHETVLEGQILKLVQEDGPLAPSMHVCTKHATIQQPDAEQPVAVLGRSHKP